VIDDKGNAAYVVRVRTHASTLGENLPIIPGMMADVDILTGKKTILSYLLKPVLRAKANALTER
jgi:adhesin transport system membrane fusion protein